MLVSPNSILANALNRTIDYLRPKVAQLQPRAIEFVVGAQINGSPHLGTHIVQTSAFVLAKHARGVFGVDTRVSFMALDNAPHDVKADPETHQSYQTTYFHAIGKTGVSELIDAHYRPLFEGLADR